MTHGREPVAEVSLHRDRGTVATLDVVDGLDVAGVQIGSMFVTSETAKTTLAPAGAPGPDLVVDGRAVPERWERAHVQVPLAPLSRWQRTKLLWAPTLRRVSLRLRRDGDAVKVRVRRGYRRPR